MSRSSIVHEDISSYATAHGMQPDAVLQSLIEATTARTEGYAAMQIGIDQGAFMSILSATLRPKFAVEVGTFTGYSSLCLARGLADDGRLLCCDVSEDWTSIARTHWEMAGVTDRIDLRIAPAIETLRSLSTDANIDLAFINADKTGYLSYYEEILSRLAPRGLILVDNTLWSGRVLDDSTADKAGASDGDVDTAALRAFNDFVAADERVKVAQLTIGDGVTMISRR